MKRLLFQCLLSCVLFAPAFAQSNSQSANDLKFDQPFTKCELKWVVFPKKDTATRYFYGFVYMDEMAGFTFDMKGTFTIDKDGHYLGDTSMTKVHSFKYRLGPNTPKVALLPQEHFGELHLPQQPGWVKIYYRGVNDTSISYYFHEGFNYNAAGDSQTALTYLDKAYAINPHYKGLEFEMAFAYNALTQPDKAIKVLEAAVAHDPNNIMFYRELGYAYSKQNNNEKAISYYKQGIDMNHDTQNDTKAEMAFNLANIYKRTGNDADYKSWMAQAKGWASPNSSLYKYVVSQGF